MFDDFDDEQSDGFFEPDEFHSQAGAIIADEPEGLKAPRDSTLCLGHDLVEKTLLQLVNGEAMPHALIFSGAQGIGKSTMAFRLARYMLKHGAIDSSQDNMFADLPATEATSLEIASNDALFSRISSGGEPDLLYIERPMDAKKGTQKAEVNVETARKVAPFLRMTASGGGWRVVIVDDADTMNRNAQNALLKILEEPPSNALLILITHRLGAMIPTIRSRCRVIAFDDLSPESLDQLLTLEMGNSLMQSDKDLLKLMASGSIGDAQKIINSDGLEISKKVLGIFEKFPKLNALEIHHLTDILGRGGQDTNFDMIEKIFLLILEQFIFTKAQNISALPSVINNQGIQNLNQSLSLQDSLSLFDDIKAHFAQAHFGNLDKKLAVLNAFNFFKK